MFFLSHFPVLYFSAPPQSSRTIVLVPDNFTILHTLKFDLSSIMYLCQICCTSMKRRSCQHAPSISTHLGKACNTRHRHQLRDLASSRRLEDRPPLESKYHQSICNTSHRYRKTTKNNYDFLNIGNCTILPGIITSRNADISATYWLILRFCAPQERTPRPIFAKFRREEQRGGTSSRQISQRSIGLQLCL